MYETAVRLCSSAMLLHAMRYGAGRERKAGVTTGSCLLFYSLLSLTTGTALEEGVVKIAFGGWAAWQLPEPALRSPLPCRDPQEPPAPRCGPRASPSFRYTGRRNSPTVSAVRSVRGKYQPLSALLR